MLNYWKKIEHNRSNADTEIHIEVCKREKNMQRSWQTDDKWDESVTCHNVHNLKKTNSLEAN